MVYNCIFSVFPFDISAFMSIPRFVILHSFTFDTVNSTFCSTFFPFILSFDILFFDSLAYYHTAYIVTCANSHLSNCLSRCNTWLSLVLQINIVKVSEKIHTENVEIFGCTWSMNFGDSLELLRRCSRICVASAVQKQFSVFTIYLMCSPPLPVLIMLTLNKPIYLGLVKGIASYVTPFKWRITDYFILGFLSSVFALFCHNSGKHLGSGIDIWRNSNSHRFSLGIQFVCSSYFNQSGSMT